MTPESATDAVQHCVDALERIAALANVTEVRGGMEDIDVPDHMVKEGGWVPIHPRLKLGLEIAAKMAQEALDSLPNITITNPTPEKTKDNEQS